LIDTDPRSIPRHRHRVNEPRRFTWLVIPCLIFSIKSFFCLCTSCQIFLQKSH